MSAEAGFNAPGRGIVETLLAYPDEFGPAAPLHRFSAPPHVPGLPDFVLDSEAGILLGEPPSMSLSIAIPVREFGRAGSLGWAFGPPLDQAARTGRVHHFMQILLIQSADPVCRPLLSRISSLRSLAGGLPGFMAHSFGDETTARIHHGLLAAGLSAAHIVGAHAAQARCRGFDGAVFVAAGIPSDRAMGLMSPFLDEIRRLTAVVSISAGSGDETGEGCEGRACGDCDERDVCDKVRAILKKYPGGTAERG